jgi:hypothetical protein
MSIEYVQLLPGVYIPHVNAMICGWCIAVRYTSISGNHLVAWTESEMLEPGQEFQIRFRRIEHTDNLAGRPIHDGVK